MSGRSRNQEVANSQYLDLEIINQLQALFNLASNPDAIKLVEEFSNLILKYLVALQFAYHSIGDYSIPEQKERITQGFMQLLKHKLRELYLLTFKTRLTNEQLDSIVRQFKKKINQIDAEEYKDFFYSMFTILIQDIKNRVRWDSLIYAHYTPALEKAFCKIILAAETHRDDRLQRILHRYAAERAKMLSRFLAGEENIFDLIGYVGTLSPYRTFTQNILYPLLAVVGVAIPFHLMESAGVDVESILSGIFVFLGYSALLTATVFRIRDFACNSYPLDIPMSQKLWKTCTLTALETMLILMSLCLLNMDMRSVGVMALMMGLGLLLRAIPWSYLCCDILKDPLTVTFIDEQYRGYLNQLVNDGIESLTELAPRLLPQPDRTLALRLRQVLPKVDVDEAAPRQRVGRAPKPAVDDVVLARPNLPRPVQVAMITWIFREENMARQLQAKNLSPTIELRLNIWHRYVVPLCFSNDVIPKNTIFLYWARAMVCDILSQVLKKEGDADALFECFDLGARLGRVGPSKNIAMVKENNEICFKLRQYREGYSHYRLWCTAFIPAEGEDGVRKKLYYPIMLTND